MREDSRRWRRQGAKMRAPICRKFFWLPLRRLGVLGALLGGPGENAWAGGRGWKRFQHEDTKDARRHEVPLCIEGCGWGLGALGLLVVGDQAVDVHADVGG